MFCVFVEGFEWCVIVFGGDLMNFGVGLIDHFGVEVDSSDEFVFEGVFDAPEIDGLWDFSDLIVFDLFFRDVHHNFLGDVKFFF